MARFCGNCGAQLDDDAKVCGQCGTPIDGNPVKAVGLKTANPEKKKKQKKMIALGILVVAAIVGVKIALGFVGTNGLVRKVVAAYKDYNIDALIDISSNVYDYDQREKTYADEYFEYAVGQTIDKFESSVGHNYKLSYTVDEIYTMSQRKMDVLLQDIEQAYPEFDVDMISEISVADVKLTAKQGSKTASRNVTITMSKEGKAWRLLYLE